jgi:hypothetical protein
VDFTLSDTRPDVTSTYRKLEFQGSGYLYVVDPAYSPTYYDWGSGALVLDAYSGGSIIVSLPSGTTAVGTDIMSFEPYLATVQITLSTGEVFTAFTQDYPNRAFVGFTSTAPIASITFNNISGPNLALDNFLFGLARPQDRNLVPPPTPTPSGIPGIGGQIFKPGKHVNAQVRILQAETASFTSTILLSSAALGDVEIGTNLQTNTVQTVDLRHYQKGEELVFAIRYPDGGTLRTFYTGPGSRNPDGLPHAIVEFPSLTRAVIRFEESFGGGDLDYNDVIIEVILHGFTFV